MPKRLAVVKAAAAKKISHLTAIFEYRKFSLQKTVSNFRNGLKSAIRRES